MYEACGPGEDDLQCWVPNYGLEIKHQAMCWYQQIRVNHTDESIRLLEWLGLVKHHCVMGMTEVLDKQLESGKYLYPADLGEHFVPCNGRLFACHCSLDNLQMVTTYMSSQ